MNLHKPNFDDDLGDFIRQTLEKQTRSQTPSDIIWRRVVKKLAQDPPPKKTISWKAPVLRLAFVICCLLLGGVGYYTGLPFEQSEEPTPVRIAQVSATTQAGVLVGVLDETVAPAIIADAHEIQAMKDYQRQQAIFMQHPIYPLLITPLDVIPHPLSSDGRFLQNQISPHQAMPSQVVDYRKFRLDPKVEVW